jgi:hypothetical protein
MRYEVDVSAERADGRLWLATAVVCGTAGVWLLIAGSSTVTFLVGVSGVLAGLGGIAAWQRRRRRAPRAKDEWLEVAPDALTLADGTDRHHVEWSEVTGVEVDEEKLVLRVERCGRPPVVVEPRYRGAGLHELEAVVRRAWTQARARGNA